jgi:hypothetical protein
MAQLTAAARSKIAPKNFALPGGKYPIEDPNHARDALARVSEFGSPDQKAEVRSKVHAKYPNMGQQAPAPGGTPSISDTMKRLGGGGR